MFGVPVVWSGSRTASVALIPFILNTCLFFPSNKQLSYNTVGFFKSLAEHLIVMLNYFHWVPHLFVHVCVCMSGHFLV